MAIRLFKRGDDANPGAKRAASASGRDDIQRDTLKEWWDQGRYAMIVGRQDEFRGHPGLHAFLTKSIEHLEGDLRYVPRGRITLAKTLNDYEGSPDEEVEVAAFLIDTYAVSNARYQRFVSSGGYEDLSLWPEDVWPHLVEFQDQTGSAGPRFWSNGQHPKGQGWYPVTGISWYEANAFAQWVGQRLLTDAEWEMAANWRMAGQRKVVQRRYPWGNSMDRQRCNVWCSGIGGPVPVDAYPSGDAPNGVRQLVGNVWEWVSSDFAVINDNGRALTSDMPMKGIRGGAYDTYFESQATSHFRTGQVTLARAPNVGFRCGLSLSDARWLAEEADASERAERGSSDQVTEDQRNGFDGS